MTVSLRKRAASLPASGRDGAERPGSRTGQTLAKQFLVPRHDDRCCERFVETITKLRSDGKIGNTVAMLSVADQFGIGLAKAARRAPKKSGFDLVYDRSSTVEPQDMRAIMTEVTHLNPDSFVA